jgi:hypothetical protein
MRIRIFNIAAIISILLIVQACVELKPNAMYIEPEDSGEKEFFASSEIFRDYITSEMWVTELQRCVHIEAAKEAAYEGEYGLHIKWDKVSQNCPWLGFGIGWDNWTGKDLSKIVNVAAVEFYVKSLSGDRTSLPWAVGIEDFGGSQAWLGIFSQAVKAEKITSEWTRIEMPLSEFNWEEQEADPSNIKQIIFNLHAEGEIFMDEIRIVEYSGGYRKRFMLERISDSDFKVDGAMNDAFYQTSPAQVGENEIYMAVDGQHLCLAAVLVDDNPFQNAQEGENIWNGDAIEVAFSVDPEASPRRTNFMLSDRHFGIKLGEGVSAWDWSKKKEIKLAESHFTTTDNGGVFEAKIGLDELGIPEFKNGVLYGFELAVDQGDSSGRIRQIRWNSGDQDGFYQNPSIWGEMLLIEPSANHN